MAQKSQATTRLQHSYGLSPITALAFYDAGPNHVLLLTGEDTWLKVYDVQTSRLLAQLKIFYSQPIHGIHVSPPDDDHGNPPENGILLWGGHSVALLPQSSLEALITGHHPVPQPPAECKAPDWIYDGLFLPQQQQQPTEGEGGTKTTAGGVLVTAHNEILPFSSSRSASSSSSSSSSSTTTLTFGPLTSPSRPILYSADLALLDATTVLVAGGTVFGEIVVWKYFADSDSDSDPGSEFDSDSARGEKARRQRQWEVLYVFTGHEGSIFGVSIAPEAVSGVRLLVSCSDDRTVRVWDVTEGVGAAAVGGGGGGVVGDEGGGDGVVDEGVLLDRARETGFGGGNSEVRHGNRDDSARCVAVAMGHVSRIWHVKFGRSLVGSGAVEVFSFGEDCSRQRWELDVDLERWAGGKGALRQCGASTCHSGKNIWSAAVLTRGGSEPLVATGGADGKIVISGKVMGSGSDSAETYEDLDLSLTFDEVLQSLQGGTRCPSAPQNKHSKPAFRYAFLSDTVMAATAAGRLFLATMGDPLAWEEVALPEATVADLNAFNVIKSPAKDTAMLGSASGKVYLFRKGHDVRELASLGEKISDIVLLDGPSHTIEGRPWSVVINVLGLDYAVLLHFDPATNTSTIDPRKIRLPEHYIITAAAFCRSALILGSRTGSLTVYTTDPETDDLVPATSRKVCKTKDAITCIVGIPGSPSSFLATCRDGKYRIFTLSAGSTINLQHEISPPVNTLEAAFFTVPALAHEAPSDEPLAANTQKSHLILHGFRGPNFLSYNDSTRSVITSIHCGGANRAFATVSCLHDPSQTRFVFSKAGTLRVVSQGAEAERVLRTGGHGREVKSLASSHSCGSTIAPGLNQQGPRDVLVATAAEDTSIRIWRHHPPNTTIHPSTQQPLQMECLSIIEGHSSGIQTLRFFTPSNPNNLNTPSLNTPNPTPSSQNPNPTYLLSSAGSEELFIHRLSRTASASYDALAVVREAAWDDRTPDRDLRIVDFDVAGWCDGRVSDAEEGEKSEDGENGEKGKGRMLITMGLSDSSVRSYVYSPHRPASGGGGGGGGDNAAAAAAAAATGGVFRLLARGRYTGACPTQVRHLRVDGEKGEVHVLTAFTDGHVAVWKTQGQQGGAGEFGVALVVRLHQSSIKSLDLSSSSTAAKGWFVATGGDDNALGFLQLEWDMDKGEYVVLGRHRVRDAHAAAVTGLCIVKETSETTEVATVSNDQRVKLWRAERSTSVGLRVALLDSRYSSVADAGDLELIAPGKLMVGGVGMELWDVAEGGIKEA